MDIGTLILAIATFSMAGATLFMAIKTRKSAKATEDLADQNRQLVKANEDLVKLTKETLEDNRRSAESPRIKELISKAIDPVLEAIAEIEGCHERREYMWLKPDFEMAKEILGSEQASLFKFGAESAFFPHPWLIIEKQASTIHRLNQALYKDLGKMHSSLTGRIEEHDKKAEDFGHLLLDFAKEISSSKLLKELAEKRQGLEDRTPLGMVELSIKLRLSTACLAFHKLLGGSEKFSPEQVREDADFRYFWEQRKGSVMEELRNSRNIKDKVEQITKEADNLIEELKIMEAQLLQIKSGYQKDYHLTYDET